MDGEPEKLKVPRGRGVRRAVKKLLLSQPDLSKEAILELLDADDAVIAKGGTKTNIGSIASIRTDFRSTLRALKGLGRLTDWAAKIDASPTGTKELSWLDRLNQILFSERDIKTPEITKRLKAEGFSDFEAQVSHSLPASRESIEIIEASGAVRSPELEPVSDPRGFHLPDELPDQGDAIDDIAGTDDPRRQAYSGEQYARDPKIRAAVKRRAGGKCEFCGELGFKCVDGTRYLESHHIIALANDGADRMTNVIALCPRDHREAHFGERRTEIEKEMIIKVKIAQSGTKSRIAHVSNRTQSCSAVRSLRGLPTRAVEHAVVIYSGKS